MTTPLYPLPPQEAYPLGMEYSLRYINDLDCLDNFMGVLLDGWMVALWGGRWFKGCEGGLENG